MRKDTAVKLTKVSKRYTLHHEKPTLVESLISRKKNEEFWALRDISLEVKKGERVGIIGPNGSGKTTLLEIISGITTPTTGSVTVNGKIVSLIELEAGFQPDLTGEENIFLNGILVGLTKKDIHKKLNQIVSYAGLKKFIDVPLYMYSLGMKLKLGFSVLVHSDPDILIIDENFGVGDVSFRKKLDVTLKSMAKKGVTFVMVSHHRQPLENLVDKVVLLEKGEVKKQGNKKVFLIYFK